MMIKIFSTKEEVDCVSCSTSAGLFFAAVVVIDGKYEATCVLLNLSLLVSPFSCSSDVEPSDSF